MTGGPTAGRSLIEARLAGLGVVALGVIAVVGATQVRPGAGFVVVGPQVMPAIVGIGLILLGSTLLFRATVRPDMDQARHIADEGRHADRRTLVGTLAALIVYAMALGPIGYVLSTTVFLPVVARILGSAAWRRDLAIGVVLSLAVYLGFTQGLGVRLPGGLLDGLLP